MEFKGTKVSSLSIKAGFTGTFEVCEEGKNTIASFWNHPTAEKDAELFKDALIVGNEYGKYPSKILSERNEMIKMLKYMIETFGSSFKEGTIGYERIQTAKQLIKEATEI